MKQKEIRYLENLLKKKKEKIEEMARKIKKNRKNRQKQPADEVIEKKPLQVKRKKVSKPIFHTVFKFIDKHTFAIFCILILIMIIVCGLYLLQNQNLKEDTSVTPMITNEPLTDSPPPILDPTDAPPKDLDTTSFSTTIMILTILGGVFFAVSFLIILLGGTQEFSIAGTRMFPLPAVAFGLFAVSLGLTLSKDDPNKVYVIISIIGLILSLFLIMGLCTRSGGTADRGTRMGYFTAPTSILGRFFTKRPSITPQNITANPKTVDAVKEDKTNINEKRSVLELPIIGRRNSQGDATSNTLNTVNKDSSSSNTPSTVNKKRRLSINAVTNSIKNAYRRQSDASTNTDNNNAKNQQ